MLTTRLADAADEDAIARILEAAFGQPDEARLVDRLRADGEVLAELVAEEDAAVVGHILFSRLPLEGADDVIVAAALAPVAVAPARQSSGIGSRLVVEGLRACAGLDVPAVVVLGHKNYYPRFGFDAALAQGLTAPFSGPSFMALELQPGALSKPRRTRYAAAFGAKVD